MTQLHAFCLGCARPFAAACNDEHGYRFPQTCQLACERGAECQGRSAGRCAAACADHEPPRVALSPRYLDAVRRCLAAQSCAAIREDLCMSEEALRLEPSKAAQELCRRASDDERVCARTFDAVSCLDDVRIYDDPSFEARAALLRRAVRAPRNVRTRHIRLRVPVLSVGRSLLQSRTAGALTVTYSTGTLRSLSARSRASTPDAERGSRISSRPCSENRPRATTRCPRLAACVYDDLTLPRGRAYSDADRATLTELRTSRFRITR